MTTDLEADLRHEFDAATAPSTLTFRPESVLRQGSRTIRRRRIISAGSAAVAVGLIAVGSTLMTRPQDTAVPQPANPTATTGSVKADMAVSSGGDFQFEFNRDAKVRSNLSLFVSFKVLDHGVASPRRQELGEWSIGKPGQKPEAIWKSGMVDGHPYTVGLVPGIDSEVTLAKGASYGVLGDAQKIAGYSMFAVDYQNGDGSDGKEPARPAEIASISWTEPDGAVNGVEGNHRLTGRTFTFTSSVSVKVLLRPGNAGRTTVFGSARLTTGGFGYATPLSVAATADASGAAVVTGRYPIEHRITKGGVKAHEIRNDGAPVAAGILPSGASDIGVELASGQAMTGLAKTETLPDGRVIFALKADFGTADPNKDAIKAISWTNADGSRGQHTATQKRP
jgi:hypothetical protein